MSRRPVAESVAELRRLAYVLEDLDDGAALPPLFVHVGVQVTESDVPSEGARMALVDRIAGALGLEAVVSAGTSAHYTASGDALTVYTPAPLACAEAIVLVRRAAVTS